MTEQRINEVLAKKLSELTGQEFETSTYGDGSTHLGYWDKDSDGRPTHRTMSGFPDSLDSMKLIQDAMPPIIDDEYVRILENLTGGGCSSPTDRWRYLVFATAAQRAESAVRAFGLWED